VRKALASTTLGALLLSAVAVAGPAAAGPTPSGPVDIIVRAHHGRAVAAEIVLAQLGGHVTRSLPVIDGFAATIDGDQLAALERSTEVVDVTADSTIRPQSIDPVLGYDPAETSSMSAISQITGAQTMWNAGYTGQGVDVALIDTGVARVPGLDAAGKVVDGADLSFDSQEPTLIYADAFGHGTHMAGIIAGSDPVTVTTKTTGKGRKAVTTPVQCTTCLGISPYTDTTKFQGIAPSARIVNVKVGAHDGATDVSQVIAGIDWVVQHRKDAGFNIRVINLSFGTDSTQSALLDPLVYAAEQAWKAGIVVVAAAGNDGLSARTLSNPAISPTLLAVGASDPRGTLTTSDDSIPKFAQHGDGLRGVDVVAPGVSVLSLRVPGGFVDQSITTGKVGSRFQRASGTSQGTAVVSGLVALLLSKYPSATPDQIKSYLKGNAQTITKLDLIDGAPTQLNTLIASINNWYAGNGSAWVGSNNPVVATLPQVPLGTGLGTLEGARGTYHVNNGVADLSGEKDIFGKPWNALQMAGLTASASTWTGGQWNGSRWTGDGWSGTRWTGATWTSKDWTGTSWTGVRWGGATWTNGQWTGVRWGGATWTSGQWTGVRWGGVRWG
jgi:serine protease AprX